MNWKVLISAPYMLPLAEEFRGRLEDEGIEISTMSPRERLSEAELLPIIENFDGAICGDDAFTARVLRRAARLKVISKWGTGIDSIDVRAAKELGIRICNTPGAFTDAVADTAHGYVLCFARRLAQMDADIRREAVALKECALGIVGVGNIGKAVVRRARVGVRNETARQQPGENP